MLGFQNMPNKNVKKEVALFENQFKSKEDIFNFIVSNPNFDALAFSFENKSAKARSREKRREVAKDFLQFLVDKKLLSEKQAFGNKNIDIDNNDDIENNGIVEEPVKIDRGILKIEDFIQKGFIDKYLIDKQLVEIKHKLEEKYLKNKFNEKFSGNLIVSLIKEEYKENYEELNSQKLQKVISSVKNLMLDYFSEKSLSKEQVIALPDEKIKAKLREFLTNEFHKPTSKIKMK